MLLTYHKTGIYPNSDTEGRENKCNLVDAITKKAWPEIKMRAETINNTECERIKEDVIHGKVRLEKMGDDDLAHGVGVDDPHVQHERNEMFLQNSRL